MHVLGTAYSTRRLVEVLRAMDPSVPYHVVSINKKIKIPVTNINDILAVYTLSTYNLRSLPSNQKSRCDVHMGIIPFPALPFIPTNQSIILSLPPKGHQK